MRLSGTDIRWYKAIPCPYVRPDGSPCYDEKSGSPWIECPICGGNGAIYMSPRSTRGTYTDNSNKFVPDGAGGFIQGKKTLSLSKTLDIHLLKIRNNQGARRVIRDKFELLGKCCNPDGSREILETLWLEDDPVKPAISSDYIYQIVNVVDNF